MTEKVYKQPKLGITKHFMWMLNIEGGERGNFEKTDYRLCDHSKIKCFDSPYVLTMGFNEDRTPSVRYQLLPMAMSDHRVNLVDYFIEVNPDEELLRVNSGYYHCIHCKLMGNEKTFENHPCFAF